MLPGHLWMVSSARYPNDFTERKDVEALTDRSIFVRQYTNWDTKPITMFMPERFKVEIGDVTRRTRVLDGSETDVNADRVMEVPMDFKEQFDKDPDAAARDIAGISVLSIRPFIGRRDLITAMFRDSAQKGLQHPFTNFSVTLQDEHDHLIPERLHWAEETGRDGKTKRRLFTGPYFAHIDLSMTGDATGVTVCHIVGQRQVSRGFGREKKFETKPVIRIDLCLQVIPPFRGEIRLSSVRELLYQLRDLGMMFGIVTYDAWGSEESIQQLKTEGFSSEVLSVDKDSAPYETLKETIYDGRLECYEMPILARELATVIKDDKTGKIDHPPHSTKDCSDSAAGAVWNAEKTYVGAGTSQWSGVMTVNKESRQKPKDDNDWLWEKVRRNLPLTEDEINRIK
jgi:hypothetical protein